MNTTDNLGIAESYYNAMLTKDCDKMASCLHDNVQFIGPLAEMQGKDAVVTAAKTLVAYCRIYRSGHVLQAKIRSCSPMIWSLQPPLVSSGQRCLWNSKVDSSLKSNCFMM